MEGFVLILGDLIEEFAGVGGGGELFEEGIKEGMTGVQLAGVGITVD